MKPVAEADREVGAPASVGVPAGLGRPEARPLADVPDDELRDYAAHLRATNEADEAELRRLHAELNALRRSEARKEQVAVARRRIHAWILDHLGATPDDLDLTPLVSIVRDLEQRSAAPLPAENDQAWCMCGGSCPDCQRLNYRPPSWEEWDRTQATLDLIRARVNDADDSIGSADEALDKIDAALDRLKRGGE